MQASVRLLVCSLMAMCFIGCSQNAVQESRTIHFGSDGTATFQHGRAGVFIDVDGETRTIFEPDETVLATSSPLWSHDKRYVIFTTATAANQKNNAANHAPNWNSSPDGRQFLKQAVHFECWLYDTKSADGTKPRVVFESNCGHVGYVAANLAAKWSPDGTAIAFVAANARGQHALKRWDIASETESQIFPHAVDWMTFEFAADESHLVVCTEDGTNEGVWIGSPGDKETDWWHVAKGRGQHQLRTATASLGTLFRFTGMADSPLERLRGLQPAWSANQQQFAFTTHKKIDEQTDAFQIHLGSLATETVQVLKESKEPLSDVQFHPDGKQLGFIQYTRHLNYLVSRQSSLQAISLEGTNESTLSDRRVHQFAGWNTSGDAFAIVSPTNRKKGPDNWAFAMVPASPGREALVVSGSDGEREVFSGMRVTFPNWSPDGKQISFWTTFTPLRQSWQTLAGGDGLHQGDPAATINVATKEIHWMPVSAIEKLQIGHYYLLKGNNAEALKWYDEAEPDLPAITDSNRSHLSSAPLYRSICLNRMERRSEAKAAFDKFIALTTTPAEPGVQPDQADIDAAAMNRYMFLLEIYLSVDGLDECKQLLQTQMADSESTPAQQLAKQIALSQVLLLQDNRSAYLQLVTDKLLPSAIQVVGSTKHSISQLMFDAPMLLGTQLSLLPLLSGEFLNELDLADLEQAIAKFENLRTEENSPLTSLVLDKLLATAHQATENPNAEATAKARVFKNELSSQLDDETLANSIEALRRFPTLSLPPTEPGASEGTEPE